MARNRIALPFHVRSALESIGRLRSRVDLVITVADARSPSATELDADLVARFASGGVRILRLFSRSDLSDLRPPNSFDLRSRGSRAPILGLIRGALGLEELHRSGYKPHFQVLVAGFPNTGKSTLINLLRGRRVAAAENVPGKTRRVSKFPIGDNIWVYDTPGILMPRHSSEAHVGRLFLVNSIPAPVDNYSEILAWAYGYMAGNYRGELEGILGADLPAAYGDFLEEVARRFGFLRGGGEPDLDRAEAKFLNVIRGGRIRMNWDRDV